MTMGPVHRVMSSSGNADGTGEPSKREVTTVSVECDVRDKLRAHKKGQESYSSLIERMLDDFEDTHDPVANH